MRYRVANFTFRHASVSAVEVTAAILRALPAIRRLLAKLPPPFVANINNSGDVSLMLTEEQWNASRRP